MNKNKGISLIEILVAIFLVALIVGPFTGMFLQSTRARKSMSRQFQAIYLSRNELEILMSKNCLEAYRSRGVKEVDDFFIRTSIAPYSVKSDMQCFYIISNNINDSQDELRVFSPDGFRNFLLEANMDDYTMYIDIQQTSFNISLGEQTMSGLLMPSEKCDVYINLIHGQLDNNITFNITGDINITIYPGANNNWDIISDKECTVTDKCFYRDYIISKVRIEAFDNTSLGQPIFQIENIIRLKN
ncbi:MAG: hypothetical protein GX375_05490 [Clostridiales bacterium]|nr:hypothetical protein [Clostridiales bacterium]